MIVIDAFMGSGKGRGNQELHHCYVSRQLQRGDLQTAHHVIADAHYMYYCLV
jgi:hypothetical protein